MPARWQRATASGDLGPRRVDQADQAEQAQLALCLVAALGGTPLRRAGAGGRRRGRAGPARPSAQGADGLGPLESPSGAGRRTPRSGSQRRSSSSGAPFAWTVEPPSSRGRPSTSAARLRIEAVEALPLVPRRAAVDVHAERRPSRAAPPRSGAAPASRRRRARRWCTPRRGRDESGRSGATALVRRVPEVVPPAGVQTRGRAHAVLGQRPGLVGADHRGRAERLDRGQALDQRAALRERPRPDGERRVIVGSRPSGRWPPAGRSRTSRTPRAAGRRPASRWAAGTPRRRRPPRPRSAGRPRPDLTSSGLSSARPAARARRSGRARSAMPVAKHERAPPRRRARRAAEDEVTGLERRSGRVEQVRRARTGSDSPGSADASTSSAPSSERASAEIRSPSRITQHDSPGTSSAPRRRRAVASGRPSPRAAGSAGAPRPPLGLALLDEREDRVEHDDRDDRDAEAATPATREGRRDSSRASGSYLTTSADAALRALEPRAVGDQPASGLRAARAPPDLEVAVEHGAVARRRGPKSSSRRLAQDRPGDDPDPSRGLALVVHVVRGRGRRSPSPRGRDRTLETIESRLCGSRHRGASSTTQRAMEPFDRRRWRAKLPASTRRASRGHGGGGPDRGRNGPSRLSPRGGGGRACATVRATPMRGAPGAHATPGCTTSDTRRPSSTGRRGGGPRAPGAARARAGRRTHGALRTGPRGPAGPGSRTSGGRARPRRPIKRAAGAGDTPHSTTAR